MTKTFDNMIVFEILSDKTAKEEFYDLKQLIKIWDVNVENIVISILIELKNNSKYLIAYLNEVT